MGDAGADGIAGGVPARVSGEGVDRRAVFDEHGKQRFVEGEVLGEVHEGDGAVFGEERGDLFGGVLPRGFCRFVARGKVEREVGGFGSRDDCAAREADFFPCRFRDRRAHVRQDAVGGRGMVVPERCAGRKAFALRFRGGKDGKREFVGALREKYAVFTDLFFREGFRELQENQIRDAERLAVVLPDDEQVQDPAFGEGDQSLAESGVVLEKEFVLREVFRRDGSAQRRERGQVFVFRGRVAGNPADEPRVFHQAFLLVPVAQAVGRRHARQDAERVERDAGMGGAQFTEKSQQRVFVVRGLFRLPRGDEAAVEKLVDGKDRRVAVGEMFHRPLPEPFAVAGAEVFVEQRGGRQDDFDAGDARGVLHESAAGRAAVQRNEQHAANGFRRRWGDGNGWLLRRHGKKGAGEREKSRKENDYAPHHDASTHCLLIPS